ncbi:MAG: YdiU family protein [Nitrospinae bacterium]|nr:YdiU family protein [Nitrospinota bacterium]MBL7019855.1 YdiU family protein [Nitrospinaceae bacterium]
MTDCNNLNFQNRFIGLGPEFYQAKTPDPVTDPYLIDFSPSAGQLIDLSPEAGSSRGFIDQFSGNAPMTGAQPLAMAYSGHQFGSYNPRLGDGRGLLLGEVQNQGQEMWDIHLKGAGPTRFARGFDGRATLNSSIREHLASEALNGLGVPTTRSLAVIGIRELIYRQRPELAAVLVRIADSHIRFGSFEFFHYTGQEKNVERLLEFSIRNYYPDIVEESDRYRIFFQRTLQRTAKLIAKWQAVGFIHGVMNTDNMCITGTTFDYGPYGFMDHFVPNYTPNHSDTHGRYAYNQQPEMGFWNLNKLAETLTPLIGAEILEEEMKQYQPTFNRFYREEMSKKLGLAILDSEFTQLVQKMFQLLHDHQLDYTNFFRFLANYPIQSASSNNDDLRSWLSHYLELAQREGMSHEERKAQMDATNPKFILRAHLLQTALDKALKESDFSEISRLRILLENPFQDQPEVFEEHEIEHYTQDTPETFACRQTSCSA